MKKYLIIYKPFLFFLGKFFLTYLVLIFLYQTYLNCFDPLLFEVDGFTKLVAQQSQQLMSVFDKDTNLVTTFGSASVTMVFHNKPIARIIEGCNALSIIILYVSFVIAFTGKFKFTVLFVLIGSLLIYGFNVLRIALLCFAIYYYPQHKEVLHGVLFPLLIYSFVFGLWMIWVNKFSIYAKENNKK